ncbi:MAG: BatA domain-containing protein [Bacteroidota bacterium]
MEFVYPWFLSGLAAVSIPIIIHLFNLRRYKVVYFSDIRFLKQVNLESKAKSKIKHLLILISRILAIVCLVLAFAQPYIPKSGSSKVLGQKAASIYIDNTSSMNLLSQQGTLLDEAKIKSAQIIKSYNNSDVFQITTNDFEPQHNFFVNKDQFVELTNKIDFSPVYRNLSDIVARQKDALLNTEAKNKSIFIISDFQKNSSDLTKFKNDSNLNVYLIPVKSAQVNNIYIDSCWMQSPVHQINKKEKVFARIKNSSANQIENIPIKLFINGKQKTLTSITLPSSGTAIAELSFLSDNPGINQCYIELTDYPIVSDDKFYFTFMVKEKINILSISESADNSAFFKLFGNDSAFVFTESTSKQIDYNKFNVNDLIILNQLNELTSGLIQELDRFSKNGGAIAFIPSEKGNIESYNNFLGGIKSKTFKQADTAKTNVALLNLYHPIFKSIFSSIPENMDLPSVSMHYVLDKSKLSDEDVLINLKNGDPLLVSKIREKSKYYIFTCPLEQESTNFSRHPLFVPLFWEIAISSIPTNNLFYTIGNNDKVELSNIQIKNDQVLSVQKENYSFIPEQSNNESTYDIKINDQIKEPGFYSISQENKAIAVLAYNLNRKESDLSYFSNEEIEKIIDKNQLNNFKLINAKDKNLSQYISDLNVGKRFWKIFVLLALLFLTIEVLLLKYLK